MGLACFVLIPRHGDMIQIFTPWASHFLQHQTYSFKVVVV